MKVTVVLHAGLRRHLPQESRGRTVVDLPEGATVADAIAHLKIPPKGAGMMVTGTEQLEASAVLSEGQELNLFPPLAGGAGPIRR